MIFKYSRKITKNFAYYTLENVKNFYIFAAEFLNILYMAGKTYSKHPKYYVVWVGRSTGVFGTWDACKEQVDGFEGAKYKAFPSRESAEEAFKGGAEKFLYRKAGESSAGTRRKVKTDAKPIENALAVDAACSGNPGDMEYRGVYVKTGEVIFQSPVYKCGTNNIGEFLAIVHGLALIKKQGLTDIIIYSDSMTAQSWVKKKKCNTKIIPGPNNQQVFERIAAAEKWLQENTYTTPIRKWDTDAWGEIPADFGRK